MKNKRAQRSFLALSISVALSGCAGLPGNTSCLSMNNPNQHSPWDKMEDQLTCPITQTLMREPVRASDGFAYEKSAIEDWLKNGNGISPSTNKPFPNENLQKDHQLQGLLTIFLESRAKVFTQYEQLAVELREKLEAQNNALENQEEEPFDVVWNYSSDTEKYELLESLELKEESYQFLKLEFRQKLSERTQPTRHALANGLGAHPSTEEFWNQNPEQHLHWMADLS